MLPSNPPLHLIVNPTAGRGAAGRMLPSIRSALTGLGQTFTVVRTEERGHATAIAKEAILQGNAVVVAVGGDGTLHEVSNAVIDADEDLKPTLGLIACGTGNDFARCVGLSGSVQHMCSILAGGTRRNIDVGSVVSHDLPVRRFLVAAGVGYIADTASTVNSGIRFLRGMPAYILGAIQTLATFKATEIQLSVDDRPSRTVEAMLISISNVATTGGGMLIAPGALCDDGLLEVCLVHKINKLELLRQLPNVIKGKHADHPAVEMFAARSIHISSTRTLPLWIDGEVIGTTPATFSLEEGRLPMLLPAT